jgi:hypothetical protein
MTKILIAIAFAAGLITGTVLNLSSEPLQAAQPDHHVRSQRTTDQSRP